MLLFELHRPTTAAAAAAATSTQSLSEDTPQEIWEFLEIN